MIYIGDKEIKKAYAGDSPVKKIYQGEQLVWSATPPVVEPSDYEAETTAFMNAISIPKDNSIYLQGTEQELTGSEWWIYINQLVLDLKAAVGSNLSDKLTAVYPRFGATVGRIKFNLLNPQDTDAAHRAEYFGDWTHTASGSKATNDSGYVNTHIIPNQHQSSNGNGMIFAMADVPLGYQPLGGSLSGRSTIILPNSSQLNFSFNGYNQTTAYQSDYPRNGIWAGFKADSTTSYLLYNGTLIHTGDGGGGLGSVYLAENAITNSSGGLYDIGGSKFLSSVYPKSVTTVSEAQAISNALENFEANVKRKTW